MAVLVKQEMNKNVRMLTSNDTVKKAAEDMAKYWMGSLVIVDDGKLVGIVTERDILSKLVTPGKDPSKVKIKDIMSKNVITIEEDKKIEDAVKLLKAHNIKKLPVMKKGKLTGIITTTDIITAIDEEFRDEGASLSSYRDLKVLVRRHSIDIKRETEKNQILTFLISHSLYPSDSISIIKAVTKAIPKVLYITVNKPYYSIVKTLQSKGVKTAGLYFIDGSSGDETVTGGGDNYEKVSGPSDLTEILVAVEKCLESKRFDGMIFDSISTLLSYQSEEMVIRFAHSLINKLRQHGTKGMFLCTKEDMKTSLMKNLNMLTDYSVDIDKRRDIV